MDLLKFLAGSTPQGAMAEVAGKAAEGLIAGIGESAIKIRQAFKGKEIDPNIAAAIDAELATLEATLLQGQMAINLAEAQSTNLFVSGWRPFIGWVCGSSLAYTFMIQPLIAFVIGVYAWKLPPLPTLDTGSLMTILLGMLGLGGMRTYEKIKGVSGGKK
jgi:Holin of 3TMs, for gene-transfer release